MAPLEIMILDPRELHPEYILNRSWGMAAESLCADWLRSEIGEYQCQDISYHWSALTSANVSSQQQLTVLREIRSDTYPRTTTEAP